MSLLFASNVNAFTYYSVQIDDASINHIVTPPSFLYSTPCNVTFTEYATLSANSFPFTASFNWYSPDSTNVLIYPATYNQNISCLNIGSGQSSGKINNYYETKTTMTTSALSHNTWILNRFECQIPTNNIITIRSNGSTILDSFSHYPYAYQDIWDNSGDYLETVKYDIQKFYYGLVNDPKSCISPPSGMMYSVIQMRGWTSPFAGTHSVMNWHIVPFRNYYVPEINITVVQTSNYVHVTGGADSGCNGNGVYKIYLYDITTNTTTLLSNSAPYRATYVADRNHEYFLLINKLCTISTGSFGSTIQVNWTDFNVSVNAYQPNLNCSAWGECLNNQQTRLCNDLNGIINPFIDQQACFAFGANKIFVGFDSGYTQNTWYCDEGWYNIISGLCARNPQVKSRNIPNGWYRNGYYATDNATGIRTGWVEDYVDVDSVDYYAPDASPNEGALKIWFIPRKLFLPVYNATLGQVQCQATNEGQVGGTWTYVNSTFWVSHNITALSPYMTFSYRSKKCTQTMPQTSAWAGCTIGCGIAGNCANSGLCVNSTSHNGDDYYTGSSCPTDPPPSYLAVQIKDLTANSTNIQNYIKPITALNWENGYQEDNINNMNMNHTYEISFSAYPQNSITQQEANCVLVDDVNVNFKDTATVCASGCNTSDTTGFSYIEATALSSGSCQIRILQLDFRCVPAILTDPILRLKAGQINYTCYNTTMITWNFATDTPVYTYNSPTCIAQSTTGSNLNPTTGDVLITGFANLFATPAFFSMLLAIALGVFATYKLGQVGIEWGWIIGVIIIMGVLGVLSFTPMCAGCDTYFPTWFYIVLIIIAGFIVAMMVKVPFFGGK